MFEDQSRTLIGNHINGMAVMSHYFATHRNAILQVQSQSGGLFFSLFDDLILVGSMLPGGHDT